jgi:hypothetical protein
VFEGVGKFIVKLGSNQNERATIIS